MQQTESHIDFATENLVLPIVRKASFKNHNERSIEEELMDRLAQELLNKQFRYSFCSLQKETSSLSISQRHLIDLKKKRIMKEKVKSPKKKILKKVDMIYLNNRKVVFEEANVRFVFEITNKVDK